MLNLIFSFVSDIDALNKAIIKIPPILTVPGKTSVRLAQYRQIVLPLH